MFVFYQLVLQSIELVLILVFKEASLSLSVCQLCQKQHALWKWEYAIASLKEHRCRWLDGYGVTPWKKPRTNKELRRLVGVEHITTVIRSGRQKWYGHVMRTGWWNVWSSRQKTSWKTENMVDMLIHVSINFCGVLQTCLSPLYFWIIKITLNDDVRVAML